MSVKQVTSVSNPIVKSIRALAQKKVRERERLFLAEGLKLALDALEGGWTIRTLVVAAQGGPRERIDAVAARVHAHGGLVLQASDKVLAAIARRDNPQTVIAVVEERWGTVEPQASETWVALERVRDPGNLGTVIRTADALGLAGVVLVGECVDAFAVETVRATMGSLFHVPLARAPDLPALAERFRAAGGRVVGTHLAGAVDHRRVDWTRSPLLVVMGNEARGLSPEAAAACDELALVAMSGRADSLNLAVSAGIVLYESRRHALPDAVPCSGA